MYCRRYRYYLLHLDVLQQGTVCVRQDAMQTSDMNVPLRHESNVLVPVRIHHLSTMSTMNLWLALASVVYCAVNIVCITFVAIEDATSEQIFHNLEFTATLLFSFVQLLTVFYSPSRSDSLLMDRPWLLKGVVFLNLVLNIIPAILIYVNLELFEVPAHQMEYVNTVISALIDVLLTVHLLTTYFQAGSTSKLWIQLSVIVIPLLVAIAILAVYSGQGFDAEGNAIGESNTHYLEFSFEILSSIITFSFCMDSKLLGDAAIKDLLIAKVDQGAVGAGSALPKELEPPATDNV